MLATKTTGSVITELTAQGSLASKFTRSLSLTRRWLGEEVTFWIRTPLFCVSVCLCVCSVLAKGEENTGYCSNQYYEFLFYFITRMLPKRKIKQN